MRETCARLKRDETLIGVEDEVAVLGDVFALAGAGRYSSRRRKALSRGAFPLERRDPCRDTRQRAWRSDPRQAQVHGSGPWNLAARTPDRSAEEPGVSATRVSLSGYRADAVDLEGIAKVENLDHETTGEAYSLSLGLAEVAGGCHRFLRRHCLSPLASGHAGGPERGHRAFWSIRRGATGGRDLVRATRPDGSVLDSAGARTASDRLLRARGRRHR